MTVLKEKKLPCCFCKKYILLSKYCSHLSSCHKEKGEKALVGDRVENPILSREEAADIERSDSPQEQSCNTAEASGAGNDFDDSIDSLTNELQFNKHVTDYDHNEESQSDEDDDDDDDLSDASELFQENDDDPYSLGVDEEDIDIHDHEYLNNTADESFALHSDCSNGSYSGTESDVSTTQDVNLSNEANVENDDIDSNEEENRSAKMKFETDQVRAHFNKEIETCSKMTVTGRPIFTSNLLATNLRRAKKDTQKYTDTTNDDNVPKVQNDESFFKDYTPEEHHNLCGVSGYQNNTNVNSDCESETFNCQNEVSCNQTGGEILDLDFSKNKASSPAVLESDIDEIYYKDSPLRYHDHVSLLQHTLKEPNTKIAASIIPTETLNNEPKKYCMEEIRKDKNLHGCLRQSSDECNTDCSNKLKTSVVRVVDSCPSTFRINKDCNIKSSKDEECDPTTEKDKAYIPKPDKQSSDKVFIISDLRKYQFDENVASELLSNDETPQTILKSCDFNAKIQYDSENNSGNIIQDLNSGKESLSTLECHEQTLSIVKELLNSILDDIPGIHPSNNKMDNCTLIETVMHNVKSNVEFPESLCNIQPEKSGQKDIDSPNTSLSQNIKDTSAKYQLYSSVSHTTSDENFIIPNALASKVGPAKCSGKPQHISRYSTEKVSQTCIFTKVGICTKIAELESSFSEVSTFTFGGQEFNSFRRETIKDGTYESSPIGPLLNSDRVKKQTDISIDASKVVKNMPNLDLIDATSQDPLSTVEITSQLVENVNDNVIRKNNSCLIEDILELKHQQASMMQSITSRNILTSALDTQYKSDLVDPSECLLEGKKEEELKNNAAAALLDLERGSLRKHLPSQMDLSGKTPDNSRISTDETSFDINKTFKDPQSMYERGEISKKKLKKMLRREKKKERKIAPSEAQEKKSKQRDVRVDIMQEIGRQDKERSDTPCYQAATSIQDKLSEQLLKYTDASTCTKAKAELLQCTNAKPELFPCSSAKPELLLLPHLQDCSSNISSLSDNSISELTVSKATAISRDQIDHLDKKDRDDISRMSIPPELAAEVVRRNLLKRRWKYSSKTKTAELVTKVIQGKKDEEGDINREGELENIMPSNVVFKDPSNRVLELVSKEFSVDQKKEDSNSIDSSYDEYIDLVIEKVESPSFPIEHAASPSFHLAGLSLSPLAEESDNSNTTKDGISIDLTKDEECGKEDLVSSNDVSCGFESKPLQTIEDGSKRDESCENQIHSIDINHLKEKESTSEELIQKKTTIVKSYSMNDLDKQKQEYLLKPAENKNHEEIQTTVSSITKPTLIDNDVSYSNREECHGEMEIKHTLQKDDVSYILKCTPSIDTSNILIDADHINDMKMPKSVSLQDTQEIVPQYSKICEKEGKETFEEGTTPAFDVSVVQNPKTPLLRRKTRMSRKLKSLSKNVNDFEKDTFDDTSPIHSSPLNVGYSSCQEFQGTVIMKEKCDMVDMSKENSREDPYSKELTPNTEDSWVRMADTIAKECDVDKICNQIILVDIDKAPGSTTSQIMSSKQELQNQDCNINATISRKELKRQSSTDSSDLEVISKESFQTKIDLYEYHVGKERLLAMQGELPVMIETDVKEESEDELIGRSSRSLRSRSNFQRSLSQKCKTGKSKILSKKLRGLAGQSLEIIPANDLSEDDCHPIDKKARQRVRKKRIVLSDSEDEDGNQVIGSKKNALISSRISEVQVVLKNLNNSFSEMESNGKKDKAEGILTKGESIPYDSEFAHYMDETNLEDSNTGYISNENGFPLSSSTPRPTGLDKKDQLMVISASVSGKSSEVAIIDKDDEVQEVLVQENQEITMKDLCDNGANKKHKLWLQDLTNYNFYCLFDCCDEKFTSPTHLLAHLLQCVKATPTFGWHQVKMFSVDCPECKDSIQLFQYSRHFKKFHSQLETYLSGLKGLRKISCLNYTCGKPLKTVEDCLCHFHECGYLKKCSQCTEEFVTPLAVKLHTSCREEEKNTQKGKTMAEKENIIQVEKDNTFSQRPKSMERTEVSPAVGKVIKETTGGDSLDSWLDHFSKCQFFCPGSNCNYNFNRMNSVFRHMKRCASAKKFYQQIKDIRLKCPECDATELGEAIFQHFRKKHILLNWYFNQLERKIPVICQNYLCGQFLTSNHESIEHLRKCNYLWRCEHCSIVLDTEDRVRKHFCTPVKEEEKFTEDEVIELKETVKNEPIKESNLDGISDLTQWMDLVHKKKYKCPSEKCSEEFEHLTILFHHLKSCSYLNWAQLLVALKDFEFTCTDCERKQAKKGNSRGKNITFSAAQYLPHANCYHPGLLHLVRSLEKEGVAVCENYSCAKTLLSTRECVEHYQKCGFLWQCSYCMNSYVSRNYSKSHLCVVKSCEERSAAEAVKSELDSTNNIEDAEDSNLLYKNQSDGRRCKRKSAAKAVHNITNVIEYLSSSKKSNLDVDIAVTNERSDGSNDRIGGDSPEEIVGSSRKRAASSSIKNTGKKSKRQKRTEDLQDFDIDSDVLYSSESEVLEDDDDDDDFYASESEDADDEEEDLPDDFSDDEGVGRKDRVVCSQRVVRPSACDEEFLKDWYENNMLGFDEEIYESLIPERDMIIELGEADLETYIPKEHSDIEFTVEYFKDMRQKGSISTKLAKFCAMPSLDGSESKLFNAGGPVWALDWCPIPKEQDQLIAVATHSRFSEFHCMVNTENNPGMIQFWNVGELNLKCNSQPKLVFAICHNFAPIYDMKWCPSGCYQEESNISGNEKTLSRIGLLAIACGDGKVRLFSVPHFAPFEKHQIFVTMSPSIVLLPHKNNAFECNRTGIALCVQWLPKANHERLAAGYGDGGVRIWDVTSKSILLRVQDNGFPALLPIIFLDAHSYAVRSLSWCPYNSDLIATVSSDKCLKVFNLHQRSHPLFVMKRGLFLDLVWPIHRIGVFFSEDDALNMIPSSARYWNMERIPSEQRDSKDSIFPSTRHNSAVWSCSYNNRLDLMATCDNAGEVLVSKDQGQLGTKFHNHLKKTEPVYRLERTIRTSTLNLEPLSPKQDIDDDAETCDLLEEYRNDKDKDSSSLMKWNYTFKDSNKFEFSKQRKKTDPDMYRTMKIEKMQGSAPDECETRSVLRICWNPTVGTDTWLASGTRLGVVRLHNFKAWK